MYCWGSTESGELGLGDSEEEQVLFPKLNVWASSLQIKQIAIGLMHTLFLTKDGQVYSCGSNEVGQLGHSKCTKKPEHVQALEGYAIIQVDAGDQHSLALTTWGVVYSWGENGFGQLGINSEESHSEIPRIVKSLSSKQVIQITCGANHAMALTTDGNIYSWGLNNNGQLGLGHKDSPVREPCLIKLMYGVPLRVIKAGGQHSAALSQSGFLITWGSNKCGQLGRPTEGCLYCAFPKIVPNLATYSEPLTYIALGENHTSVLDSCGKLWTFGQGKYGQLGHGSFDDSSVPRPVLDLLGSKVCQLACGRSHTIVYVPSQGQALAFGQGLSGQLGINSCKNFSSPQIINGPWNLASGKNLMNTICAENKNEENPMSYVNNVYAGGDASFIVVSKKNNFVEDFCCNSPFPTPFILLESKINEMLNIGEEDMIGDDLFTYCETTLCSLCCWNGSFCKLGESKLNHNLDYRLAEECVNKLGRVVKEALIEVINSGIQRVIENLPSDPITPEVMKAYVLMPLWKGFGDIKNVIVLQNPYAKALLKLHVSHLIKFKKWLHTLPLDFIRCLVSHYKKLVAYIIRSQKNNMKPLSSTIEEEKSILLNSIKVLDMLYKENKSFLSQKARLPYEEFYISEIAESVDLRKDYVNWLFPQGKDLNTAGQICFCEFSFLFDSKSKTILLRVDATRQMQGAIQSAVLKANPLMYLINPDDIQFLTLHVTRNNLVADTINQINKYHHSDLKKPLKVHFIGEEAEDAGGVRKEFFLLLLKELLNPDYGMFMEYRETNTIWFRDGALEVDEMFYLIGIVCGLAIYNTTIINLPFPLGLYKKLLDEPLTLDDLSELDPTLCRSLRSLLEYDGHDFEDVFCLNFAVTQDYFGENVTAELKKNGKMIPVTLENRHEYVDLYVDWHLNQSIDKQYQSFHKGFHRVCGGGVLKLFQPMELMALVTGNENYDWTEFQNNTCYQGEYYKEHSTIKLFWEVFDELTLEQKKKFLLFLTGCDRVPILGMKTINMTIVPLRDDCLLPVAHTCVIQLDLPIYRTKEKLKYKLLQAIQETEGFGLV